MYDYVYSKCSVSVMYDIDPSLDAYFHRGHRGLKVF